MSGFPSIIAAAMAPVVLALLPCDVAVAQEDPPSPLLIPQLSVTATRIPTPQVELGSNVTVITGEEIELKQQRTLPEVLRDVPGLNVVQTGGPGGLTSVFIRGTNSNHVKVFVDGIDVSDPSSPNGAFDFAHLLTGAIERVEVLRGPQSGLYGSDAIGGVISITTRSGEGPPRFLGRVEGGSFGTVNQTGLASGALGRVTYSIDAQHFSVGATPVTPLSLLPPGRRRLDDSYDNLTVGAKLGIALTDTTQLGAIVRHIDTTLDFTGDDFNVFPAVLADVQSRSKTHQLFTRGFYRQSLFDGAFDYTIGVGFTGDERRDVAPEESPTLNHGERLKFDALGNWHFAKGQTLTFGAEHQRDEIVASPISAGRDNDAGYVQWQTELWGRLFNTASLRYDSYSTFGNATTYRIAPALLFPETGTRLKASIGTGFKAPSLNQLFVSLPAFNFFANPDLKPERSFGYDAGFEQSFDPARIRFGATWFHNDISDLITTNDTFTSYANVARAVTHGIEAFVESRPWERLLLRTDYTFTIADDTILHTELLRRPRHKVTAGATWQANDKLSLAATLIYVSSWADVDRFGTLTGLRAPGYVLANLAAEYDLGRGLTAFARIDNLFDERYQNPLGFQRPGIGAFAGIKLGFDALDLTR